MSTNAGAPTIKGKFRTIKIIKFYASLKLSLTFIFSIQIFEIIKQYLSCAKYHVFLSSLPTNYLTTSSYKQLSKNVELHITYCKKCVDVFISKLLL